MKGERHILADAGPGGNPGRGRSPGRGATSPSIADPVWPIRLKREGEDHREHMRNTPCVIIVVALLAGALIGCAPTPPVPSPAQVMRIEPGWSMAQVAQTLGAPIRRTTTWRGEVWTYRYVDLAGDEGRLTVEFEADRVYLTART